MRRHPSRFARLDRSLSHRKGVRHPRALAAWIGDRKYGAETMAKRSAASRRRHKTR